MKSEEAFNELKNKYDICELFSLGLYRKFNSVKRIHFDESELRGIYLFTEILLKVKNLLKEIFEDSLFICLVYYTDSKSQWYHEHPLLCRYRTYSHTHR